MTCLKKKIKDDIDTKISEKTLFVFESWVADDLKIFLSIVNNANLKCSQYNALSTIITTKNTCSWTWFFKI